MNNTNNNSSSSNNNDSESAAEFVATVRQEHVAMKTWYNTKASSALKEQYGQSYPSLWKQVLNWPGWRDARREYLQSQQKQSNNTSNNNNNHNTTTRKRKSRWGSAAAANNTNNDRGRSTATAAPAPLNPTALPLPGLLDMSSLQQNNPQVQQLQAELRACSEKLQNVDREAARVDQLPVGHRERSPSPPPSEYAYGI